MSRKRNYRGTVLLVTGILLLLGIIAFLYFYEVKHIHVKGNTYAGSDAIVTAFFPEEQDKKLYRVLIKLMGGMQHPVFSSVTLRMKDPETLELLVKEKPAVLRVDTGDQCYLYADNGYQIGCTEAVSGPQVLLAKGITPAAPADLTEGQTAVDGQVRDAIEIGKALEKNRLAPAYIFYEDGKWGAQFEAVDVIFGSAENIADKTAELVCIFPEFGGLSGTLHMEDYRLGEGSKGYYFRVKNGEE